MASLRALDSSTPVQSAGPGVGAAARNGNGIGAAAAPSLGQAASAARDTQDRALNLMSREIASRFSLRDLNFDEKARSFSGALNLEPPAIPTRMLKLSKQLTRTQSRFIKGLFHHPLHTKLSLVDLWGFDFVYHFKALMAKKGLGLPLVDLSALLKKFSSDFGVGYLSRVVEPKTNETMMRLNGLIFYERYKTPEGQYLVITSREWAYRLEGVADRLKALLKPFRKSLGEEIDYLQESLMMGRELLLHPDSREVLSNCTLEGCLELFPEASRLNDGSAEERLQRLGQFAKFVSQVFAGLKVGAMKDDPPLFLSFGERLEAVYKSPDRCALIRRLKLETADLLREMSRASKDFSRDMQRASAGEADAHSEENRRYFLALFVGRMRHHLMSSFLQEMLSSLDEQILAAFDPENHVPLTSYFTRFDLCFMAITDSPPPKEAATLPRTLPALSADCQSDFASLFATLQAKMMRQVASCFRDREQTAAYLRVVNKEDVTVFESWLSIASDLREEIANFSRTLESLEDLRREALGMIDGWLNKIDKSFLAMHRETLINALQEAMLRECFDLFHLAMIVKDSKAIFKLDGLRSEIAVEETLTDSLIDLVELEGIEELFDRLTEGVTIPPKLAAAVTLEATPAAASASTRAPEPAPAPAPDATPAPESALVASGAPPVPAPMAAAAPGATPDREPASAAPMSSLEPVSRALRPPSVPAAAAPARPDEERARFTIRRGEKVRKIVAKLRAWGFYPSSNTRGRGSHRGFENADGKRLTVPMGGHRTHMKPGTAASVAAAASE